ncbi:DNA polymerase III PolC-type [Sinorhizobium sp. KGO-5]|nr:DNA polymerase III PolC-type [Sinorhizobium sp. KGO-5]
MASQLDMFPSPCEPGDGIFVKLPPPLKLRYRRRLDDESMAQLLEERGSDRVLRKLVGREIVATPRPGYPRVGVIVDTETTGLDHRKDEIIEIGAVAFTFDDEGHIGDVTGLFGGLQKPTVPIPPEITRLTEITDEMVAGQMIDVGLLGALIDPADLVIAHNARFGRPFCQAFSSISEIYQWEEADPPLKRLTAFDRYKA